MKALYSKKSVFSRSRSATQIVANEILQGSLVEKKENNRYIKATRTINPLMRQLVEPR